MELDDLSIRARSLHVFKKEKKCIEQVVFDISEIPECIKWWRAHKFCDFSAGMSDVFRLSWKSGFAVPTISIRIWTGG
ncbi:hypothetical protein ACS0PU_001928 [Formica fusca]